VEGGKVGRMERNNQSGSEFPSFHFLPPFQFFSTRI